MVIKFKPWLYIFYSGYALGIIGNNRESYRRRLVRHRERKANYYIIQKKVLRLVILKNQFLVYV